MAATKKSNAQLLFNGILTENPIFRLALSMCPAVGITTTVMNGILLGIAVLFVQVFSSCTISAIKDYIHPRIRIPTYTLTIAMWVTVIDLVLAKDGKPISASRIRSNQIDRLGNMLLTGE